MISKLIVPLDGCLPTLRALDVAAPLAKHLGAEVMAVTVTVPELGAFDDRAWLEEHAVSDLVAVDRQVVLADDVPGTLLALAEPDDVVLCMASHGRSGAGEALLGSVSAEVVRRSPHPVLLVGPEARPPDQLDAVVIGVDGEGHSMRAVDVGGRWAAALGATPWLVSVDGPDQAFLTDTPGRRQVDAGGDTLLGRGLDPRCIVRCDPDPAGVLIEEAERQHAVLVVVAARHRSGVRQLVLGSTSRALVRRSTVPVLVVGPEVAQTS